MGSDIQKKRNRRFFIEAAEDIVRNGDLNQLTAREIADRAGFSYATIYNYFTDLDELLWVVTMSFIEDIMKQVTLDRDMEKVSVDTLIAVFTGYFRYFFRYPNVFKLFFFKQTGAPPEELSEQRTFPSLGMLLVGILENLAAQQIIRKDDIPVMGDLVSSSVHGILLFYFSKKTDTTETECLEMLERSLRFVFERLA